MKARIQALFNRYEQCFNQALAGDVDLEQVAAFYAPEFIAASPAGVSTGKNDAQLQHVMAQGYAWYRSIGTKSMRIRSVRVSPIDTLHCIAHVSWTATYARPDQADVSIDFDVHYLVQQRDDTPKIFGWISGDEQALLRERGIV
jgi:hypothetical protein